MPLVSGQQFAGYTVLRLLGSGGMGEVYLAQHPRLPRRDALKVLPETMTDSDFRERFNREADIAATLWHPHVVGVHDRGEDQGRLWLSMDFVEGADAGELLRDWYPSGMPVHEVCTIVTAVAGALDHVHQRGLLHRDVKPANILLTHPEGVERRILLADFGIARQLADAGGLTATNVTVGTVFYAAPEQLMGADIDGRADQYALAATAFHLLTGSPMYEDTNPVAIISQHLKAKPPKLSDRRPDLAHLDQAFFTALAKDPSNRYDGCRQFATALGARDTTAPRRSRGAKPVIGNVADNATVPGTRHSRRRDRLVVVAASAIVICALLGLCGGIAWQQREQQRAQEFSRAASQGVVTMTSLDFKKAKFNVQRVLDSSTGAFRTDFERRAAEFTAAVERSLIVTESTVKNTTVESMSDDSAVVLVAAKSEVTDSAGAQHEPLWWRVSVTVARDGGQLKMSKVECVPQNSRFDNRAD